MCANTQWEPYVVGLWEFYQKFYFNQNQQQLSKTWLPSQKNGQIMQLLHVARPEKVPNLKVPQGAGQNPARRSLKWA